MPLRGAGGKGPALGKKKLYFNLKKKALMARPLKQLLFAASLTDI